MRADNLWQMFLETGAPELYLLYSQAKKAEECNVFNSSGTCFESEQL